MTRWYCYLCRLLVDRAHIKMVLSHQRHTGRCEYRPSGAR